MGGQVVPLGDGWFYRIDPENDGTRTKRHIHIWRKGEEYAQNDDGSPHEKKGGKLPSKVNERLKEKTGWDYNGNREAFYNKTEIVGIDACEYKLVFADGTEAFWIPKMIGNLTLPFSASIDNLESIYESTVEVSGKSTETGSYYLPLFPEYLPVGLLPITGLCPLFA